MRSKNTLILLLVLLVLAVAAYFFTKRGDQKSTLNVEETAFAIQDTASVNKIFISTKAGESHMFERMPNNSWRMDNKFEARKDLVNLLLETMYRVDVKRPVDKGARNTAIRDIATMGRKVEIYQNNELTKVFHVGETTDSDKGTYFIMEGSETPYVLHIPGFQGFLNTRFDVSEFNWRSVPVFRSHAGTIKEVKINYLTEPKESYTVTRSGDEFQVSGVPNADQETVAAYLDNFKFVNGEFYYQNPMNRMSDSLALKQAFAEIIINDVNPVNSASVLFYSKPEAIDHYVAVNQKTKDIMSVQKYVFNRIFLKRDAFRKNSAASAK